MKIKIAKYYVCRDCNRKTQTSLGLPANWMLILVARTDQWEVLCPDHHIKPKYNQSTTTNTGYYKFTDERWNPPRDPHLKNESKAEFLEHMDDEADDDEPE